MIEVEIFLVNKKQLCKVRIETTSTVKDIKRAIQDASGMLTCRQSLRSEAKGKDISDSTTLALSNGSKLFVKDLGPQISWTTVFLAEYFGPLVVYALFAMRPRIIYGSDANIPLTTTATIAWLCWSVHYIKRLLETLFVHRFSHGTMPVRNLFKNCGYYWGFAAFVAYFTNHPLFTPPSTNQMLIGLIMFALCEAGNFSIHILLRNLRPAGSTVRKIPKPDGNPFTLLFNFVSCPNYTYEFGAWLGFTIMTSCIPALIFAAAGMYQMSVWALGKHRNYKKEFSNYPKRKAIVPFVL
ncbi:probable very-long-chain enoyl-CoA reductase art-1 [Atheta coriaria]|uniref:probable very-long-chain enoyl-CoA reductase art-1 n=1 Tax=Dalotia coriaria TaxID=877792 RepID=UPI0031F38DE7